MLWDRDAVSCGAVDRDLKGRADGAHPGIGKAPKPADQHRHRNTFHRIKVHSRTAGDRVGIGFKNDLACQAPDGSGARGNQSAPKPGDTGRLASR